MSVPPISAPPVIAWATFEASSERCQISGRPGPWRSQRTTPWTARSSRARWVVRVGWSTLAATSGLVRGTPSASALKANRRSFGIESAASPEHYLPRLSRLITKGQRPRAELAQDLGGPARAIGVADEAYLAVVVSLDRGTSQADQGGQLGHGLHLIVARWQRRGQEPAEQPGNHRTQLLAYLGLVALVGEHPLGHCEAVLAAGAHDHEAVAEQGQHPVGAVEGSGRGRQQAAAAGPLEPPRSSAPMPRTQEPSSISRRAANSCALASRCNDSSEVRSLNARMPLAPTSCSRPPVDCLPFSCLGVPDNSEASPVTAETTTTPGTPEQASSITVLAEPEPPTTTSPKGSPPSW